MTVARHQEHFAYEAGPDFIAVIGEIFKRV